MVKIINAFGDSYSGQAAKAGVFAHWKGRQYRRKYVIPSNPKTAMQLTVRGYFTNAVDWWHGIQTLRRRVFSYLATGLVMSGFNLLVKRYQLAATSGGTLPLTPPQGIKQIASASAAKEQAAVAGANPRALSFAPAKIGSLTYTPLGADTTEMDAYVGTDMGDVQIPTDISTCDGAKGLGNAIADGDQLVISYQSGGRTIVREVLYTVAGGLGKIPAAAAIGNALRTKYYPIDLESVVLEVCDVSEEPDEYTQLESLEVWCLDYSVAGEVVTPAAWIYFDLTAPGDALSKVNYTSYTAIVGAKLEVMKADTSFITWRDYSSVVGAIPIAQTIEDETYDWNLSAGGYASVIRAAQSAILSTKHELVEMTAV
jgi:hypothetical protein